jgi:hypothetical protein
MKKLLVLFLLGLVLAGCAMSEDQIFDKVEKCKARGGKPTLRLNPLLDVANVICLPTL